MRLKVTAVMEFLFVLFLGTAAMAQTANGGLRGKVTDPSGAVVQNATVTATSADGKQTTAISNAQGNYEMKGLAPGSYTVTITAKGFTLDTEPSVAVTAGAALQFDIALQIAVEKEQVQVQGNANTVDPSGENNASALVIKGKDLDALSDDPDELADELSALAGPSAGPNGGQIYIDGFTGGQLPPKASIREIRVNQNPFSAEYDKLGYGRIEVFTKPGMDAYHGQVFVMGNDNVFNATNPFATRNGATIPPYHSEQFSGNVSGPIVSKKASFFFNIERRNINDESVIYAQVFDPTTFGSSQFTQAVSTPRERTNISPRLDYQISQNNTLSARYQFWRDQYDNNGVGQYSLPAVGFNSDNREHTFQISDTQILSPAIINETRFQYVRDLTKNTPLNYVPLISVQGAFNDGGNGGGYENDHEDRYELQNYTSWVKGKHMFKFGGRLRATRDATSINSNFNGTYTFTSMYSYALSQYYLSQGVTMAQIQADPTSYCTLPSSSNIAPVPGQCAGVSQYSQTIGSPSVVANYVDAGLYFQDEYKMRPNLTLSYGLRFETQNAIQDHGDWAPRVGIAWGIGRANNTPKTVLRAGYGIFYDRLGINQIMNTERLNGELQQQYLVTNPCFYDPAASVSEAVLTGCDSATASLSRQTEYQFSPKLQAPYTMQFAASLERQLWKNATGALTYINSRGVHQLVTINANAPLPGTYDPTDPASAVYPYDGVGNVYQYFTEGIFKQNQLMANINWRAGSRFSLFGNYTLSYANSDVNNGGFPTNSYDIEQDYGPAAYNARHRAMIGGSFSLPYGFRFSPFVFVNAGQRYNITSGQDTNGDSIYNDRPYLCSTPGANGCVATALGDFAPGSGTALVPINSGVAPPVFTFNMRFGKTFGLGPKLEKSGATASGGSGGGPPHQHGGGGNPFGMSGGGRGGFGGDSSGRKYSLTFNVMVHNLFNNLNEAAPVANLSSPYFGQTISLAGGPFGNGAYNRRLDLQVMFSF
jgi:hypothetical protein